MSILSDLQGEELLDALLTILSGKASAGIVGNPRLDQHPAQVLRNTMRSDTEIRISVQDEYSNLLARIAESNLLLRSEEALIELFRTAAELPVRGSGRPIALVFSNHLNELGETNYWWPIFETQLPEPKPVVFRWFEALAANQSGRVLAPRWASSLESARNSKVLMAVWAGHALANPEGGLSTLGTLLNKVDVTTTNSFGLGTLVGSLLPVLDFDQVSLLRAALTLKDADSARMAFLSKVVDRAQSVLLKSQKEDWRARLQFLLDKAPIDPKFPILTAGTRDSFLFRADVNLRFLEPALP